MCEKEIFSCQIFCLNLVYSEKKWGCILNVIQIGWSKTTFDVFNSRHGLFKTHNLLLKEIQGPIENQNFSDVFDMCFCNNLVQVLLNSLLNLLDVIVLLILFISYYIYVQNYGELNLKEKYIEEMSNKYQLEPINPIKSLGKYLMLKFR